MPRPAAQSTDDHHPEEEVGAEPLAATFQSAFQSARLRYRGVEATDTDFLWRLKAAPSVALNSTARWPQPMTRDTADGYRKALQGHLIAVIIELDPPHQADSTQDAKAPSGKQRVPIGTATLSACFAPEITQCRTAALAIDVLPEFQGRGYGSEAMRWILDWAFDLAGLHRVRLGCFGFNTRGIQAYEKVGFERVGVEREATWMAGRYWDVVLFGMLDRDWAKIKAERQASARHSN